MGWFLVSLLFGFLCLIGLLVWFNRLWVVRRGVRIGSRWYVESALKWYVTGIVLFLILGSSRLRYSSLIINILIWTFSLVAVWSSPYRRKARIIATVGLAFSGGVFALGALSGLVTGRGALYDHTLPPTIAALFTLPSLIAIFAIWLTARRASENESAAVQSNLLYKKSALEGQSADRESP
jgi:hypothetical protein